MDKQDKQYIERLKSSDVKEIARRCYGKETNGITLSGDHITVGTDDGYVFTIRDFSIHSLSIDLDILPNGEQDFIQFMYQKFGDKYADEIAEIKFPTENIDMQLEELNKRIKRLQKEKEEILKTKERFRTELKMSVAHPAIYYCFDKNMKPLGEILTNNYKVLLDEYPDLKYFCTDPKQDNHEWFMVSEEVKQGILTSNPIIQCSAIGMNNYRLFMEDQSYKYTGSLDPNSYDLPPHLRTGAKFSATDDIGQVCHMQFLGPNTKDKSGMYYLHLKDIDTGREWSMNGDWFQGRHIQSYEDFELEQEEVDDDFGEI